MAMAEIANHATNEPWPSLEVASKWFDRASVVLVGTLIVGAVTTFAIVWMENSGKEHHWDLLRERANIEAGKAHERAAFLEKDAEEARAAIAQANERAAEANARGLEAQLASEKFKTPRTLSPEQQRKIAAEVRPFGKLPFDFAVHTDPEATDLMEQVAASLEMAGWVREKGTGRGGFPRRSCLPANLPQALSYRSGFEIQIDDFTYRRLGARRQKVTGRADSGRHRRHSITAHRQERGAERYPYQNRQETVT